MEVPCRNILPRVLCPVYRVPSLHLNLVVTWTLFLVIRAVFGEGAENTVNLCRIWTDAVVNVDGLLGFFAYTVV